MRKNKIYYSEIMLHIVVVLYLFFQNKTYENSNICSFLHIHYELLI